MTSLLEKAKKFPIGNRGASKDVTDEEIELYLAIFKKEIYTAQARRVLYPKDNASLGDGKLYSRTFKVMREAYNRGKIKIHG